MKDPRSLYPRPPFPEQKQEPTGSEKEMTPAADHGEKSYEGSGRLEGRRALITGADSGIGRAVALAFAREGAAVAIGFHESENDAQTTENLCKEAGVQTVTIRGDIASADDCRDIVRQATSELGGIDILVNNAAFQRTYEKFEEIPDEEFERIYQVNIFGMFRLCKLVLPDMKPAGAIINTASIQSFDPSPSLLPYASTKAAIASFTKSLAAHAIERGVRVNAVAPGPVWTPLIPATMPKEDISTFGKNTVFGRPAQPAELAPIFVFLASDEASYVTGEIYGATGGRMPI